MKKQLVVLILIFWAFSASAATIYVDTNAPLGGDGTTRASAYKYLQNALAAAPYGDEIRVAQGIYHPDRFAADPNAPRDPDISFHIIDGTTLKGGHAGFGQSDPNARDIKTYETILSGDMNGNDGPDFTNHDENSYHLVASSGTNATTVLDGFAITGGNADSSGSNGRGGTAYQVNGLTNNGPGSFGSWHKKIRFLCISKDFSMCFR